MRRSTAVVLLLLSGCEGARHAPHEQASEQTRASVAERPPLSFTHWSTHTELFLELPTLVRGAPSTAAAHVTTLSDFQPLGNGRVALILRGPGGEERFVADAAASPGIFRPIATPSTSGKQALSVEITSGALRVRHELGELRVYESVQAALRAERTSPEPAGRITFSKEQQWPMAFATVAVTRRELAQTLRVPGKLIARADADLTLRAPVAGRIVPAEGGLPAVGAKVSVGQTLALIAPRLEAADIASLELAIQHGELEVQYAESEHKRLAQLLTEGAVPERRVIEAEHEVSSARAALSTAQRRLSQFRRLESTSGRGRGSLPLIAPFPGVLSEVHVAPGAFAEAGAALFRVVDTDALWLEARVAEADVAAASSLRGASFQLSGAAPIELGPEQLVGRSPTLDARSRTQPIWFRVDNRERAMAIGTLTEVFLTVGEPKRTLAVPSSALVDDGGTQVVFVQVEGEAFERRVVQTGLREREWVAIERGLAEGERVVSRGAPTLRLAAASGHIPAHGHAH